MVSTRMDPAVTWTPLGFWSAAMLGVGGTVEEKVVELDKEMVGWGWGISGAGFQGKNCLS